jgi:hypothetical protein
MRSSRLMPLVALVAALGTSAAPPAHRDVGPNNSPAYEKECGSCHFAYQPGWLPERSWRRIMATLKDHFGEAIELKSAERDAVLGYLVAGSAERAANQRSLEVLQAIAPGDTPLSITRVLYVGGIHGGFLDPAFKGEPQAKTLAQCPLCHQRADRGRFSLVTYTVSDESFRTDDVDMSVSMPVPAWMRGGKK